MERVLSSAGPPGLGPLVTPDEDDVVVTEDGVVEPDPVGWGEPVGLDGVGGGPVGLEGLGGGLGLGGLEGLGGRVPSGLGGLEGL